MFTDFIGDVLYNAEIKISVYVEFFRAAEVVDKCSSMHREFFSKSALLHFTGLKTFQNKVRMCSVHFNLGDVFSTVA
jgi:hypothetical protein